MTTSADPGNHSVPSAPDGRRFELRVTEHYQRTKRNVLLATAIATIIGISGGTMTKIPVSENALPVTGALVLVWITALFFTYEFAAEWRMTFVRNSVVAAGKTDDELDELITPSLKEKVTVSSLEASERALERAMKIGVYPSGIGVGGEDRDAFVARLKAIKDETHMLRAMVMGLSILDEEARMLEQANIAEKAAVISADSENLWYNVIGMSPLSETSLEQTRSEISALRQELPELIHQDRKLVRRFDTLHRSIHRIQRISLYVDRGVVSAMVALASGVTAYRLGQWWLDPKCGTFVCPLLDWVL